MVKIKRELLPTNYACCSPRGQLCRKSCEPSYKLIRFRHRRHHVGLDLQRCLSVLICPTGERFSRAPPDPSRPRDRATSAPRGSTTRCRRRKIGRRSPTRRAGGVERCSRGRACSIPVWRGSIKMKIPVRHRKTKPGNLVHTTIQQQAAMCI